MTTNKDDFDTTYRKVKGFHIIGYDADTDTFSKLHIDQNGHIFAKLVGDAGATNVSIVCDSNGYLFTKGYTYGIAEGEITGHRSWSKIGFNGAVASDGSEEEMWPVSTAYTFPTTEQAMYISSASNTDTGATGMIKTFTVSGGGASYTVGDLLTVVKTPGTLGKLKVLTLGGGNAVATAEVYQGGSAYTTGAATTTGGTGTNCTLNLDTVSTQSTGARTVTVYWLDDDYVEFSSTITLNGDTPELVGTNVFRVQNARVATTGTGLVPAAAISIKGGATTYGYISLGRTRMRQCVWTVPTGKTLYINSIAFAASDQSASKYVRFTTKANFDNLSGLVLQRGLWQPYNEIVLNNTAYNRALDPPTKLAATVDLKVSVSANSAAQATCALRGWLE